MDVARFAIGDYPLYVSDTVPTNKTRFAIGDYPLYVSDTVPTNKTRFAIGEFPTGSATPEKFHVWNADLQQWLHEPRYVWDQTNQTWNPLS